MEESLYSTLDLMSKVELNFIETLQCLGEDLLYLGDAWLVNVTINFIVYYFKCYLLLDFAL